MLFKPLSVSKNVSKNLSPTLSSPDYKLQKIKGIPPTSKKKNNKYVLAYNTYTLNVNIFAHAMDNLFSLVK